VSNLNKMKDYPYILAISFFIFFIVLAITPLDRAVWAVEVIPVVAIFLVLVFTFKKFRFTDLSYSLILFGLVWHTIGAHYTFANVPFDLITNLFDFQRNHYDRIGHFVVGLYAYPIAEFMVKKRYTNHIVAMLFALFFIMSIACAYEIVEWIYAELEGGNTGIEFLGSQGDNWDAQKDMLANTLGAVVALWFYWYGKTEKNKGNKWKIKE